MVCGDEENARESKLYVFQSFDHKPKNHKQWGHEKTLELYYGSLKNGFQPKTFLFIFFVDFLNFIVNDRDSLLLMKSN